MPRKAYSNRDPATMTNAQIVAEYERIEKRQSEICQQMINDGSGNVRPSDMRANPDIHPLAREVLANFDRNSSLFIEAGMRYGPDLVSIKWLADCKKSYRRKT